MCCDEMAVAAIGDRLAFTKALQWAVQRPAADQGPVLGAAWKGSQKMILERIRRLLGAESPREGFSWWPLGFAALIVPALLTLSGLFAKDGPHAAQPATDRTPTLAEIAKATNANTCQQAAASAQPRPQPGGATRPPRLATGVRVAHDNPLLIQIANSELVWKGVRDVVAQSFRIEHEEPPRTIGGTVLIGRIDTLPMPGVASLEPLHHDSANDIGGLKSTLQSIRRYAVVKVVPAENGGYWVDVAVYKELQNAKKPETASAGSSAFRAGASLASHITPKHSLGANPQRIPQGRDTAAEQRMIGQILDRFTPKGTPIPAPPHADDALHQHVSSVNFVGNTFVSAARLKKIIESGPPRPYLSPGKLDTNKLEEDVNKLTAYYRSFGYFHAKIGCEAGFNDEQNCGEITFAINEGPRYSIRNIRFLGNRKLDNTRLAGKCKLAAGQYYDANQQTLDLQKLRDEYGSEGYVFAKIEADNRFLAEPGKLDIVYSIDEGGRDRGGPIKIEIKGEVPHTMITTALNRLSVKPGDIIDPREIRAGGGPLKPAQLYNGVGVNSDAGLVGNVTLSSESAPVANPAAREAFARRRRGGLGSQFGGARD